MPNGGPDNCLTCCFNRLSDGRTGTDLPEPSEDDLKSAWCTIREHEVRTPSWSYCANHHHHNPERLTTPVGPVYSCFMHYSPRVIQEESPDSAEIRAALLVMLESLPEHPTEGSPTETHMDEEVIKQLMKLGEPRAIEGLRRAARFDPLASTPEGAKFRRNRVPTVAWAVQALGAIAGDDALSELEMALKSGLRSKRLSEAAREQKEIRFRAVLGLSRCRSCKAAELLRRASLDPEQEISRLALAMWLMMPGA